MHEARVRREELKQQITDDLEALLAVLPPRVRQALEEANRGDQLLEVVLDLGRVPEARFLDHELTLSEDEVTEEDIQYVLERISDFDADNRAGIARTLHRISAIRNRKGKVVGLTCRVGRAVYGTIDIIRDIIESGQNILILGKPGVGKTTLLREAARVLAEKKRVVIVDTSNEIGGDGDIPHPAIGRARRMQVATPALQHEVMIEAVENHMPEVIIIDEIGRELEAAAARTIAERGVQLIATAHGNTLDNLLMNPTLSDLVGGIQAVTLSDEEARRRGTQKTVLERKAPPTFDVLIEQQSWHRLRIHHNVAEAVDAILRGRALAAEIRVREEDGTVRIERAELPAPDLQGRTSRREPRRREEGRPLPPLQVYPYGIGHNRLQQAAQNLHLPVVITRQLKGADLVMTLKNYYRKRRQPISDAEERGIPIYVLRSNTVTQIEEALADIYELEPAAEVEDGEDAFTAAMREAQEAIERVLNGERMVELSPRAAYIRRRQHELARAANLHSYSQGREPNRRVRIYANRRA
ncbi:MAG: AAA family ATPase [Anaerolineae bacterium]|nr:AAA family ATPase [Anaerolineae bacterium]